MNTRLYFWIFAALSAVVLFAPLRTGDLAGYDDAHYAEMAKEMVLSGDWVNTQSNGYPALEHPPLLQWVQAALFQIFGFSDAAAKFPSAVCGLIVILLVYWLALRLLDNPIEALAAMAVMMTSIYFLKYAARAMTDVPFTCCFLCAICAWILAEDRAGWYLAAGAFTAAALMTRGLAGFALPATFGLDLWIQKKRPPFRYLIPAAAIAFVPLAGWYAHWLSRYGQSFLATHSAWLSREVYGDLSPKWRRYTGAFEYAFMLCKSYWPWLPFMVAGLVAAIRGRNRRLLILAVWTGVMFALCSVTKSRVLRYMLPAYPAFSILAAIGLFKLFSEQHVAKGLKAITPLFAAAALVIAAFLPARWHAAEIRPIAKAATYATPQGARFGFYDAGQPRYDETNQLLWYGDRYLDFIQTPGGLAEALRDMKPNIFIVDRDTYRTSIHSRIHNQVIAKSGHLICVRLSPG